MPTMDITTTGWSPDSITAGRGTSVSFTNQTTSSITVSWDHYLFGTTSSGQFPVPANGGVALQISNSAQTGTVSYNYPPPVKDVYNGTITVTDDDDDE